MGLALHEAWLTQYGNHPRLMVEATIPSLRRAKRLLVSTEWDDLGIQLDELVENFDYKIVPSRTRWQM